MTSLLSADNTIEFCKQNPTDEGRGFEYLQPIYTIGTPMNACNEWIRKSVIQIDRKNNTVCSVLVLDKNGSCDMLISKGMIGGGHYGRVYYVANERRQCAVKIMKVPCSYDTTISEKETWDQKSVFDMGHPRFNKPKARTKHTRAIFSAFFGGEHGLQIMELGEGTAQKFPDCMKLQKFILQSVLRLFARNLCYTDFRSNNIIYGYDEMNKPQLRLGDIDGVGSNIVETKARTGKKWHIPNRGAMYPFVSNQALLGYPICALIQTWYSAMVTLYEHKATMRICHTTNAHLERLTYTGVKRTTSVARGCQKVAQVFGDTHPFCMLVRSDIVTKKLKTETLRGSIQAVLSAFKTCDFDICSLKRKKIRKVKAIILKSIHEMMSKREDADDFVFNGTYCSAAIY